MAIELQSKRHRDLLDIVDVLRAEGISKYIDLPQIIVCGDQSSGKSSALEAISGLAFPTKDSLCTRFATELILRRDHDANVRITIQPGDDRSDVEKALLRAFNRSQPVGELDLGLIINEAKNAMGLSGSTAKTFSKDVLKVEVSSPDQPHLTIVDLPGLFRVGSGDQSDDDAVLVTDLVLSYMRSSRSIILAVVSAATDVALQEVTRHARQVDPQGLRTIGLITKPDLLYEGSEREAAYVKLARNVDISFRLGWHVLRNRDFNSRNASQEERDDAERNFFQSGVWRSLDASQLGICSLRDRLSNVLRSQIEGQLPEVMEEIHSGIADCHEKLSKLGEKRDTASEHRAYLLQISERFSMIIRDAVCGNYFQAFFVNTGDPKGYNKRLRAVVQNTLLTYAEDMRKKGHTWDIVDGTPQNKRQISRAEHIRYVRGLMTYNRGCELPGTFNPLIIGQLFTDQCRSWASITEIAVNRIFEAAKYVTRTALRDVTDGLTAKRIWALILRPALDRLKHGMDAKLTEVLKPYQHGHPITYNHYLTDNVHKAFAKRQEKEVEARLKKFFGVPSLTAEVKEYNMNLRSLQSVLSATSEPDMEKSASNAAIDWTEAYYKVALKNVVDEVGTLVIEQCLLEELQHLLTSQVIMNLSDQTASAVASEGELLVSSRVQLAGKFCILEKSQTALNRYYRKHDIDASPFTGHEESSDPSDLDDLDYIDKDSDSDLDLSQGSKRFEGFSTSKDITAQLNDKDLQATTELKSAIAETTLVDDEWGSFISRPIPASTPVSSKKKNTKVKVDKKQSVE